MSACRSTSRRVRAALAVSALTLLLVAVFLSISVSTASAADWTAATVPPEMCSGWVIDAEGRETVTRGADLLVEDSRGNLWAFVRNMWSLETNDQAVFLLTPGASGWVRTDQGIDDVVGAEDWYVHDVAVLGDEVYVSTSEGVFARRAVEAGWRRVAERFEPWVDDLAAFDGYIWGSEISGIYRYDPASGSWSAADGGLPTEAQIGGAWPFFRDFSVAGPYLYVGLWDGTSPDNGPRDPTLSKTGVYRWKAGGSSWEYLGGAVDPREHGPTEAQLTQDSYSWGPTWVAATGKFVLTQLAFQHGGTPWFEWRVLDTSTGEWRTAAALEGAAQSWPFLASVGDDLIVRQDGTIIAVTSWRQIGPGVAQVQAFDAATNSWDTASVPVVRWDGGLETMHPADVSGALVLPGTLEPVTPAPSAESPNPVFVQSVPLPTQVSKDPQVIGTNFALALVFAVVFGLTSTLFNNTVKSRHHQIETALLPLGKRLVRAKRLAGRISVQPGDAGTVAKVRRWVEPVVIVLVAGLIYAFLDPGFGFSREGLLIFASFVVSVAVVTYAYEGLEALASSRHYRVPASLRIFPAAVAIAAVCVLISRLSGFTPGYLYGFVGGFAFAGAQQLDVRRKGRLVLLASCSLLAVSLAAWFAAMPVSSAVDAGASWAGPVLGILVAIFIGGLEGVVFGLVPLSFMDGGELFRWNRWVWGSTFGVAVFLFWHVLLNRNSRYGAAFEQASAQVVIALLCFWTLVTVGTWLYFRKPRGKAAKVAAPVPAAQVEPAAVPVVSPAAPAGMPAAPAAASAPAEAPAVMPIASPPAPVATPAAPAAPTRSVPVAGPVVYPQPPQPLQPWQPMPPYQSRPAYSRPPGRRRTALVIACVVVALVIQSQAVVRIAPLFAGSPGAQELVGTLETAADPDVREKAARELASLHSVSATDALVSAAKTNQSARLGLVELRDRYIAAVSDPVGSRISLEGSVALRETIGCLAAIDDAESARAVGDFICDGSPFSRDLKTGAVEALGAMTADAAHAQLIRVLVLSDTTSLAIAVKKAAASSLARHGDAVEGLIEARGDPTLDEEAELLVDDTLVAMGDAAVGPLADLLGGEEWVEEDLARLGSAAVPAAAVRLDGVGGARYAALSVLLKIYGRDPSLAQTWLVRPERAAFLIAARDEARFADERDDALEEIIGRIGEPAARELMKLIGERAWAEDVLAAMGTSSVALLVDALDAADANLAWGAARVLGSVYHSDPALVSGLMADLTEQDLQSVARDYTFYVTIGAPGSEATIKKALDKYGTSTMSLELFTCGNDILEAAAEAWASKHHVTLSPRAEDYSLYPKWGIGLDRDVTLTRG